MKPISLFLTLLTLLSAAPARAELLPRLFVVSGVAADDTLNVRAAAKAGSADIGDLAPNEMVEVIALNDNRQWGQIIWHEGNGWVAMRYLQPVGGARMPDSPMPLALHCGGTEPFWSAELLPGAVLAFSELGGAPRYSPIVASTVTQGRQAYSFAFSGGGFSGLLERAECSDDMSDITYGWRVRLISSPEGKLVLREGCCRARLDY